MRLARSVSRRRVTSLARMDLSVPVTLEHEGGPVVRRGPELFGAEGRLGLPQGLGRPKALDQNRLIEAVHELGRGPVGNPPEAGDDAWRSRVHEAAREAEEPLSTNVFAERGLAGRENDEVRGDLQPVDVARLQEAVDGPAVPVDHRQNDSGEL